MRCKTLANELRRRGHECRFICRKLSGNMIDSIECDGFKTAVLTHDGGHEPLPSHAVNKLAHSHWLETDWETDAIQTIGALRDVDVDWLIVDHYALDCRWESHLRPHVKRILVIDDLADRAHDCDALLDQNLVPCMKQRYDELVPPQCTKLMGPHYALLQPEYARLRPRTPPRLGPARRVLAFFGGCDKHNVTGMAVDAFLALQRTDVELDVVLSQTSPHNAAIRAQVARRDNVTVYDAASSLAPLMLQADVALGAGGATSWERCCMGLPTLIVTVADNQKHIAAALAENGLANWLGHYDKVTVHALSRALEDVICSAHIEAWSRRCMTLLDGKGAQHVATVLELDESTALTARPARLHDERVLVRWFQDAQGQLPSRETRNRAHLYAMLRKPEHHHLYVVETKESVPLGFVLFTNTARGWTVEAFVDGIVHDQSLTATALQQALVEFRRALAGNLVICSIAAGRFMPPVVDSGDVASNAGQQLVLAICSDRTSWMNAYIPKLVVEWTASGHNCCWSHNANSLSGGDACFYLSYGRIVKQECLNKYRHNLVVHGSDLPKGKGWSPLTWLILEGAHRLPVTLIEAVAKVDSGPIYAQKWIELQGNELVGELRASQAKATQELCSWFVDNFWSAARQGVTQTGDETFYGRRGPEDSRLDIEASLADQFNLLRVVDNTRYPAFFEIRGRRFKVSVDACD